MRTILRALVAACVPAAFSTAAPSTLHAQAPTSEEYAVWSVALDSIFAEAKATRLVVEDVTSTRLTGMDADYAQSLTFRLGVGFPRAAVDSLLRASAVVSRVEPRFHTRIPVQRRSEAGPPLMHVAKEFTEPIRIASYPHSTGIIDLSRVGFDPSGRYAAVMVDYYCGPLCANTSVYAFRRTADGGWELMGIALLTQS